MLYGTQFSGTVAVGETRRWQTRGWNATWVVAWQVTPKAPLSTDSAPQLAQRVTMSREADATTRYFVDVTNMSTVPVDFDARYAVINS